MPKILPLWGDGFAGGTAVPALHSPEKRERVLALDMPWEGDGCDYFNIVRDGELYRMYYLAWNMAEGSEIRVCCVDSRDGLHWTRPALTLRGYNGSANNILLDRTDQRFDNFFVFIDTNPAARPGERFKALAADHDHDPWSLWAYVSADGLRFTKAHMLAQGDQYDTLNTCFYDARLGRYVAYVRGFHSGVRDIRRIESPDFISWSPSERISFADGEDFALYTNNIMPYPGSELYIGLPTRYVERAAWSASFERLCGAEARRERMRRSPRYGLALTDCLFMSSPDGLHWSRFTEAFMRPGAENGRNWVYGDCYPAYGMIETPSAQRGAESELSIFAPENHWSGTPTELYRYALRKDGFASFHAGRAPRTVVTKPFIYQGSLGLNFSTSAAGYVRAALCCGGERAESEPLFGDSTRRAVDIDAARFTARETTLELELSDADVYAALLQREL